MNDLDQGAAAVARWAERTGMTVGVAESLTGGMVAAALAAAEGSSQWFRGAIVAYSSEVKHGLLAVPPGPVVSEPAARAMAASTRRLLGADLAVALTGAGGPSSQDGRSPGTVFLAVDGPAGAEAVELDLDGGPEQVCRSAAAAALDLLVARLPASS
ncbi:CinA family protein [Pseudonocardia xishanensis]|uniref:CinA C-terminal domain-containing protein n=1 Tax=Pseudonocardia xishanensis TaxID=630995 RepID=A0ABP8RTM1_9PSEU